MLDLQFIRENPETVAKNAKNKNVTVDVKKILKLDATNRELITRIEAVRARQKAESMSKPDAALRKKLKQWGDEVQKLREQQRQVEQELRDRLFGVPAMVLPGVPVGKDESGNVVLRAVGNIPKFSFTPKDYLALAQQHDLIDVERAGKVSGSRFGYLKNEAALLEMALMRYALDRLVQKEQFIFMIPPVMISSRAMTGMGYLEHGGAGEMYHFTADDLYFVGTSEQSVGPYHMDEILEQERLPLRYCAYSTCFRREAGAAGKDTRGILRVHQFNKLEMFVYCRPEESAKEHERLLALEERLMQGLGLAYRVVELCTGDLGKPSARTYDIETWLPSQRTYRETHSTSNCVDFQARRLNIRFRHAKTGKIEFVHTLNGTAFASPRILAMVLEQNQQADGTIRIPEVLRSYMSGNPELIV